MGAPAACRWRPYSRRRRWSGRSEARHRHRRRRLHRLAPVRTTRRRRLARDRRRLLHRLLRRGRQAGEPRGPRRRARLRPARARPADRRLAAGCSPERTSCSTWPPRPAFATASAGLPALRRQQPRRHPARVRGGRRRRRRAGRVGLVLVRLRRRGGATRAARPRPPPRPRSPYGVTKRACEDLARVYRSPDLAITGTPLLHRLRSPAAAGHGDASDLRRPRSRRHVPAVRRRVAVARLHLRGRRRRRDGQSADAAATAARLQHRRWRGGDAWRRSSRPLESLAHARPGSTVARPSAATCAAPRPTSRARRDLGWSPSVGLREGLRSQFDWVSARRATLAPAQAVPQTA